MLMLKKMIIAFSLILSGSLIAAPPVLESKKDILAERQSVLRDTANVIGVLISELALQKGDQKGALAAYMTMLDRTQNPEVAARVMEIAITTKDFVRAQRALTKWQQIEPKANDERNLLIWHLNLSEGQTKKAFSQLPEIFKNISEDKARSLFLFLAQFVQKGDENEVGAFHAVQKQAKKYPQLTEAALCLILYGAAANNEAATLESLGNLAKLNPELSAESQIVLGLLVKNRPQFVVHFFEQVPSKNLGLSWQKIKIGVLLQEHKNDVAFDAITVLMQQLPDDTTLLLEAGYLGRKLNKPAKEILPYYQRAYDVTAGVGKVASQAAILAGVTAFEAQDAEQAKIWFNRVTDPYFAFDRDLLLAQLALEKKDVTTAQSYLNQAKKAQSQNVLFSWIDLDEAQYNIYYMQKKYSTALKQLNQMIQAYPKSGTLYSMLYRRAFLYSELHNYSAAVKDFAAALALNYNPDVLNSLGYTMLMVKGQEKEGLQLLLAAHKLKPDAPEINDSLGWAYFKLGQTQAALPYLEAAFAAMPIAEVAAHLGEALWSLGKEQEARVVWEQGLFDDSNHVILLDTLRRYKIK